MQKKTLIFVTLLLFSCQYQEIKPKLTLEGLIQKHHLIKGPWKSTTTDVSHLSLEQIDQQLDLMGKMPHTAVISKPKATRIAYGSVHQETAISGVYWHPVGFQLNIDTDYTYCTQYNSFLSASNLRGYLEAMFFFPMTVTIVGGSQKFTVNASMVSYTFDMVISTNFGFPSTPFSLFRSVLVKPNGFYTNSVITTEREPNDPCPDAKIDPTQSGEGGGTTTPDPGPYWPIVDISGGPGDLDIPEIIQELPIWEPDPEKDVPIPIVARLW